MTDKKLPTFKEAIEVTNHAKNIIVPEFGCHHDNFKHYLQDQIDVYNELQLWRNENIFPDMPFEPQLSLLITYPACEKHNLPSSTVVHGKKEEDNGDAS